jgi:hypothetical protein
MPSPHFAKRGSQLIDMSRQQPQSPLRQIDGEEAASGHEVATVSGHGAYSQRRLDGYRFAPPILRAVTVIAVIASGQHQPADRASTPRMKARNKDSAIHPFYG